MELRQLQYLVAVVEEGSFTKAALKAHVAQPGVSAQVRRLEREVGQVLLDRSGPSIRPTQAGAALLPYARAALSAVAAGRDSIDALAGLLRGHLTLGTVASISSPSLDLPGLLAGFHHDHPGIEITLREASSDQLTDALLAGSIDLALIGLGPTQPPESIAIEVFATEPAVAAVTHDDPLATRTTIALAALHDRPLIVLPKGTGLRARLDSALAAANIAALVAFEAGDPHLLAQLAARGLGTAILPAPAARAHHDQLHILTITRPCLAGQVALARRADGPTSPATQAFLRRAHTSLNADQH